MAKVYETAYELGISLDPDVDWWELFGNMTPESVRGCYLMGPASMPPPYTQAIRPEDRYVIRPLLMLDSRDERTFDTLLMNEGDFAHTSLQVFTSTYNLQHLADAFPEDVVTVHGFEVDSEYGKWDFK